MDIVLSHPRLQAAEQSWKPVLTSRYLCPRAFARLPWEMWLRGSRRDASVRLCVLKDAVIGGPGGKWT